MHYSKLKVCIAIGSLLLLVLMLGGCQPAETPAPAEPVVETVIETVTVVEVEYVEVTVVVEPTPTPTEEPPPPPDHSAQIAALAEGFHGDNYDVGHGPNTWCSRCHSPQNWDPAATVGPPPACMTCKFPTDEEIRIAPGNPWVLEEDWVGIQCDTCHILEDGVVTEGIAWLNPVKMEYEAVSNPTELCEKCHVTTTGNAFGSGVDHKITLGGSAHLGYGGGFTGETLPPTYCTDCHDPHNQVPKQCEECHTIEAATHAKGKYAAMPSLTCMACHDASGADVGPHPDEEMGGVWVPQVTTMGRGGPSTDAIVSHSIVYTVACDRCHFEENPWELTVYDAEGEIPEPEEGEGGGP
jgi:hypothetical protein